VDRYASSEDDGYRRAAEWVVNAHLGDAITAYFVARRLPWRGEQAAISYLEHADRSFLTNVEAFLACRGSEARVEAFARIVRCALDPVGGLWPDGTTPLSRTWEALVGADTEGPVEHR